jgi:uncharacterized protein (DUF302 family)
MNNIQDYALQITVALPFAEALNKVAQLLKEEGFGVLTEINVQETLKNKLGLDSKPYRILGACNPTFAHRALEAEPHVGVLLPCNVVVWDEGNRRVVSAMEPLVMSRVIANPIVAEIATEVSARLRRVLTRLEQF